MSANIHYRPIRDRTMVPKTAQRKLGRTRKISSFVTLTPSDSQGLALAIEAQLMHFPNPEVVAAGIELFSGSAVAASTAHYLKQIRASLIAQLTAFSVPYDAVVSEV